MASLGIISAPVRLIGRMLWSVRCAFCRGDDLCEHAGGDQPAVIVAISGQQWLQKAGGFYDYRLVVDETFLWRWALVGPGAEFSLEVRGVLDQHGGVCRLQARLLDVGEPVGDGEGGWSDVTERVRCVGGKLTGSFELSGGELDSEDEGSCVVHVQLNPDLSAADRRRRRKASSLDERGRQELQAKVGNLFAAGNTAAAFRARAFQCNHASRCGRWCPRLIKGPGVSQVFCVDPGTGEKTDLSGALAEADFRCPLDQF